MLLAIAGLLALIAIIALILRPALGVPLVFLVRPVVDAAWEQPLFSEMRLPPLFSVLVAVIVIAHGIKGSGASSFARMPLRAPWFAFSIYVLVFSSIMLFVEDAMTGLEVFFRHINGIVGFFMMQAWFRNEAQVRRLMGAIALAGLFPMAIGLYQLATGYQWYEQETEGLTRYIGLYHDAVTVRFDMMQTLLATLVFAVLHPRLGGARIAAISSYFLGALVVVFKAYSKSAIVTLLLWYVAWTVLRRRWTTLAIGFACALALGLSLHQEVTAQITQLFNKELSLIAGVGDARMTFQGRWFGWAELIDEWKSLSPWQQVFGSGHRSTGAHNDYLQLLMHGGVAGLSLYVLLLSAVGVRVVRNLARDVTTLNVVAAMALLMWLVDAIGLVPSSYPPYQWFVWGVIGLAFRFDAEQRATSREGRAHAPIRLNMLPAPSRFTDG